MTSPPEIIGSVYENRGIGWMAKLRRDWNGRFNWAVKKLHKRLLQLGAQEFYIRGEGDVQHEEGYVYFNTLINSMTSD